MTGERRGFASLQDLFAFLEAQAHREAPDVDERDELWADQDI